MLAIVVRLEQCDAQVQLEHDASAQSGTANAILWTSSTAFVTPAQYSPNRPDVARLRPAQLQDHFGRPVMARRHDRAVMFVIERGAAKVDQSHVRALDTTHVATLQEVFHRTETFY